MDDSVIPWEKLKSCRANNKDGYFCQYLWKGY